MSAKLLKGPDIDYEDLNKIILNQNIRLIIINLPGQLTESCTEEQLCLLSAMLDSASVEEWTVNKGRPVTFKKAFEEMGDNTPLSRNEIVESWKAFEHFTYSLRHADKKVALYVPLNAGISALAKIKTDLTIKVYLSGEMQLITSF